MSQVGSRRLEPPTAIPNAACPSDLGSDTLCGTDFGYDALTSEAPGDRFNPLTQSNR